MVDTEQVQMGHLQPPAFKGASGKRKWREGGRSFMAAPCPVGGEVAGWVAAGPSSSSGESSTGIKASTRSDRVVYFGATTALADPLIGLYTETYTLFVSLQRIVAASLRLPNGKDGADPREYGMAEVWDKHGKLVGSGSLLGPPRAETVGHMRRLVDMYLEEVSKVRDGEGSDVDMKARLDAAYYIFRLAQMLYLPQDGRGEGLLGEEILDWLNDLDPAPDNALGNEIMATREPWSHPSFFPYIVRCILRGFHLPAASFLRTLQHHPHPPIARLGPILASHLSLFPRSHNTTAYPLDHQFLDAHRGWLRKFRAEVASFTGGKPKGKWLEDGKSKGSGDHWAEWEADLRGIVEVMEGNVDRVWDESADWREGLAAYGLLCDISLRRDGLPNVMKKLLPKIPLDQAILDDSIQASLCSGDIVKALLGCHELDLWLAAHLGDVLDKLALVPDDEERFDNSLRDYFLLEYADLLAENPKHSSFWRIIADYLAAAGDEGRCRLSAFIQHVGLGLTPDKGKEKAPQSDGDAAMNGDADAPLHGRADAADTEFRHFAELREACVEHKLEEEWKSIAAIMADRLIRRGDYGLASTMCLQAEDGHALSRIAERIVDAYLQIGEEEYLRLVDTLPPSLLNEAPVALAEMQLDNTQGMQLDGSAADRNPMSVFTARLAFLAEFRDYILFLTQGAKDRAAEKLVNLLTSGVTPPGLWAVLLSESVPLLEDAEILFTSNDTFELLRVLQDVASSATFAPHDYLDSLATLLDSRAVRASGSGQQAVSGLTKPAGGKEQVLDLAHRKIEECRLALARNLARALVVGFDNPIQ